MTADSTKLALTKGPQRGPKSQKWGQNDRSKRSNSAKNLVIPPLNDRRASDLAIKVVVEEWLLPQLLEKFLKQRGIIPKSRFLPKVAY